MTKNSITVIKRDNSREPFNPQKIHGIAVAAGLTEDEAKITSQKIIEQVKERSSNTNNEIKSTTIRDIFLEELKEVNEYAAGLYEWYEKSKTN